MRITIIIFSCFFLVTARSQTIGGNSAYNFLQLSSNPILTSAGGVNVSYNAKEAGLASGNPSLLNSDMNGQMNVSFANFPGGIKAYSLSSAFQYDKFHTTFGGHIFYIDYGSIPQTDAAGNISGNFRPIDFVIQFSASRKYLDKWTYGGSLKFIGSGYQQYKSSGIALDFGILYSDSVNNITASLLSRNMGMQIKTYAGGQEDLPFDLQIGITKRLAKAPFGFSLTAWHVHQFNILYNDTTFVTGLNEADNFINKLLSHFVVATHIYIGNNLEATFGYNHLRRMELNMGSSGNGLNGFSAGIRIKFQKIQILYSRSSYQRNISFNHFGITLQLNKLFAFSEL